MIDGPLTAAARRPRAFLGMPYYGEMSGGAARAFYWSTAGGLQVKHAQAEGSLLAQNMNRLWVAALNESLDGREPDYFAMIHSDIFVEDHWLDVLVDELESNELDVLGVVIPIKDTRGVTSTALARPDGDKWRPHARLTMAEAYRLPETFTSEDVGYPLLLNTGLWVCKFAESWARQVRFTVNDRIGVNVHTGRYEERTEPEDWYFSRLLHEMGKRVGCTRKVKVGHQGRLIFPNYEAWGEWSHDEEALTESPVPESAELVMAQ